MEPSISGRLLGLQARVARPFWGVMGAWSVLCGALASKGLRAERDDLLVLALVLLLADVAWGTLWDLGAGTDWFGTLATAWPPKQSGGLRGLPYTQRRAPAGRLLQGLNRLLGWWRESFWPQAGGALLGLLAATLMAVVLSLLLPAALRPLNGLLLALVGLGVAARRRGRDLPAGEALAAVGLGWLAGHLAFAPPEGASALLALFLAAAAWGGLRLARGLRAALLLLDGGQLLVIALLVALKQPLPAGLLGLLLLGQVALQPSLGSASPAEVARRTWPWLMAAMLVAALAVP
jgi:hypothetical protein